MQGPKEGIGEPGRRPASSSATPQPTAGRRVTTVWEVPSTTTAILELAEQLAGQGVQRVVVESTSDYWRPFVYLLEARALDAPFGAAALHGGAIVRAA